MQQTHSNSVANLSAPPLIENRNLREDKENLPKNVIIMGNDVTKNQCMENLKLVRTDEISEKQKSVHSSTPQKRPHFRIQNEDNNILTNEKKKIKVLQYLPLTLSDASHRRCPQVSVGVGPTPGLLQSATTCPPDHIIPDKNTPQSCNIKKQLPRQRNVIDEVEDKASTSVVQDQSRETDGVHFAEIGAAVEQRYT